MDDFYLNLGSGHILMQQEDDKVRVEVAALHLEESKVTTLTLFLEKDELKKLGEWINNDSVPAES